MTSDLALIRDAAREAGALALKLRDAGLEVTAKPDGSPVTNADLAVDAMLARTLLGARQDFGWLSEETADDPSRLAHAALFVVDPIDGTRAFAQNHPWFTVCIAVVRDGRPTAAAVFAPELDEMYEAQAGGGAMRNGRPIRASDATSLEDLAMLGDARLFASDRWPQPWPQMRVTSRNSIAYRMALVACGAFDAAIGVSLKNDWDVAAGDLIVGEAGGVVTDHLGRPFIFNRPQPTQSSLVCAAPGVHGLLLQRLTHIERP